ncbi:MAG: cadherin domain-containing protein [Cyclobacteriaceae bacterium]
MRNILLTSTAFLITTIAFAQNAPTSFTLTNNSIAENETVGTVVGTLSSVDADGDANMFELVAGIGDTDNSSFTIQNNNELVSAEVFDRETKSAYNIRIRVTDQTANTYEAALQINISNVNEAPSAITFRNGSLTLKDGFLAGEVASYIYATDPDGDNSFRFELVSGSGDEDNDKFELGSTISQDDNLVILETVDYETKTSYNVRLAVFDDLGESYEEAVVFKVIDNQNAFSEWLVTGVNDGGVDKIYTSASDEQGNFYIAGQIPGSYGFNDTDTIENDIFIAKYSTSFDLIQVQNLTDLGVEDIYHFDLENSNTYIYGNVEGEDIIIKYDASFKEKWRFNVDIIIPSPSNPVEKRYHKGTFDLNNGKILFGRSFFQEFYFEKDSGQSLARQRYYQGQNNDVTYLSMIDTSGVKDWINYDLTSNSPNTIGTRFISDLKLIGEDIYVTYLAQYNTYEPRSFLKVIDTTGTEKWTKSVNNAINDIAYSKLAVSESKDVFWLSEINKPIGYSTGVRIEGNLYTASGPKSAFISKYNADGILQNLNFSYSAGATERLNLAGLKTIDGNVFFYGSIPNDSLIYGSDTLDLESDNSAFILKLNSSLGFSEIYDFGGNATMDAVDLVSTSNDLFFSGNFSKGSVNIGSASYSNNIGLIDDQDIYIGKIDPDFSNVTSSRLGKKAGELKWRDASQSEGGLIYGFGDFIGEVTIGDSTLFSEDRDLVIATFHKDQTISDIQYFKNEFTNEYAEKIQAFTYKEIGSGLPKKSFNLIGKGEADKILSFTGVHLTPNQGTFMVQLNQNFFAVWSTSFGPMSNPKMILDSDNNIYVAGEYGSPLDIGGNEVTNGSGTSNALLMKYSSGGSLSWYKDIDVAKHTDIGAPSIINNNIYLPIHTTGVNAASYTEGNIDISFPNSTSNFGSLLAYDLEGMGLWGTLLNGENYSTRNIPIVYPAPSGNIGFLMNSKWSELDASGTITRSPSTYNSIDYTVLAKSTADQIIGYGIDGQISNKASLFIMNSNYDLTFTGIHNLITSSELSQTKEIFVSSELDSIFIFGEYGLNLLSVNSAPESISLSTVDVEENLPEGTFIAKLTVNDNDQTEGFDIQVLDNNNYYTISNDTLYSSQTINFEVENENQNKLKIKVTDGLGGELTQLINMNVIDVNDPPSSLDFGYQYANEKFYGSDTNSQKGLEVSELLPVDSAITVFTAVDEDANESFTYSFVTDSAGFDDYVYFKLNADTLQVADTLDYELIQSRETVTNVGYYKLLVRVTDKSGASYIKQVPIGLINENENPVGVSFRHSDYPTENGFRRIYDSLLENYNHRLELEPKDPDGTFHFVSGTPFDTDTYFSFNLVSGEGDHDNELFTVIDSTSEGSIEAYMQPINRDSINFEVDSILNVRVGFYNHDSSFYQEFPVSLTIIDLNDEPDSVVIDGLTEYSIAENTPVGTRIGLVRVIDEDRKSIFRQNEISIAETTFSYLFGVDENDSLFVASEIDREALGTTQVGLGFSLLDLESNQTYNEDIRMDIEDVNEAPVISIPESLPYINENDGGFNLRDWNIQLRDPEFNSISVELIAGEGDDDNAFFDIPENTTRPRPTVEFNHEEKDTLSIRIKASDPEGLFDQAIVKIRIADQNDIPSNITLDNNEILENEPAGTLIGKFEAIDEDTDDSHFFQFTSNGFPDNAFFTISGSELITNESFDYEGTKTYTIGITTSDLAMQQIGSITNTFQFEINILDEDDGPILSNAEISENLEIGSEVGTLSINSGATSFEFVGAASEYDNESFSISGNQLLTAEEFDFETKSSYIIRLQVTGESSAVSVFNITITDANDAPSDLQISNSEIAENLAAETLIGDLSAVDQDESDVTFTYSALETTDFEISGSQLLTARSFDFGTEKTLSATVTVSDDEGATYEQELTITILNDPTDDDEENILGSELNIEATLYPNPARNILYTGKFTDFYERFTITDVNGKVIMKGLLTPSIDVTDLKSGVYFIKLSKRQNSEIKKFIIEK